VRITFVRLVKGRPKGKSRSLPAVRMRAGAVSIKRPKLSAARWRLTFVAGDAAGNRSRPKTLDLTVPRG
jgi:hypothetical protein